MRQALIKQLQVVGALMTLVLSAGISSAENTIIEHFDYTDGSALLNQNGGSGWGTAWTHSGTGSITTISDGLTYPDLPSTPAGGKMLFDTAFQSTSAFRVFETGFSSGSVYVSFLMDSLAYDHPDPSIGDVVGGRFAGVALFSANGTTSANEKVLLGQGSQSDGTAGNAPWIGMNRVADNGSNLVGSLGAGAAANFLPAGRSDVETLVVAKIEFDAGGTPAEPQSGFNTNAEKITLWLNPDLGLPEESNAPIGGGPFVTERDMGEFKRIRLGGGGYSDPNTYARHVIDELRISDVTPFAVPGLDGDHNGDGEVDALDYVVWRMDPLNNGGDPGGYDDWAANYGNSEAGSGSAAASAVPEPSALLIALLASCGVFGLRSRR